MNFSPVERWLNFTSLPIVALGILLILLTPAFLGKGLRWSILRYRGGEPAGIETDGSILSASLGLLALLLGFLFAMAIDRFDQRRSMVVEEANAITAAYLMAQSFEEPHRGRITSILVDYVNNRVTLGRTADVDQGLKLLAVGHGLQSCLWSESLAAAAGVRDDVSSHYLETAHQLIETGAKREASRRLRIPPAVYAVLLLIGAGTTAMLAFALSASPTYAEMAVLVALVTAAIVLVVDLDRPTTGRIIESQFAMERLQARIAHVPQYGFDGALSARLTGLCPPKRRDVESWGAQKGR